MEHLKNVNDSKISFSNDENGGRIIISTDYILSFHISTPYRNEKGKGKTMNEQIEF